MTEFSQAECNVCDNTLQQAKFLCLKYIKIRFISNKKLFYIEIFFAMFFHKKMYLFKKLRKFVIFQYYLFLLNDLSLFPLIFHYKMQKHLYINNMS